MVAPIFACGATGRRNRLTVKFLVISDLHHPEELVKAEQAAPPGQPPLFPPSQGTYFWVRSLRKLGRFEECEPLALEFHARTTRAGGSNQELLLRARKLLADLYQDWGKPDEAAKWQ